MPRMERFFHHWIGPLLAALLVGYVVTTWGLRAWLPAPSFAPLEIPASVTPLFDPSTLSEQAAKPAAAISLPANVQLLGTALPTRAAPHALLRIDGKSVALHVGETLPGGARLLSVEARAIEVERVGQRSRIALGAPPTTSASANASVEKKLPALPTPQAIALAGGCPASTDQRRSGTVLAAELIAGALQNATSIAGMFTVKNGKLTVQNSAGVGTLLALRDGDILRSANGRPLSSVNDITQHVLTPLSTAQVVSVEMERQTTAQTLTYLPPGCKAA
jgi:general secretion pathway protein C